MKLSGIFLQVILFALCLNQLIFAESFSEIINNLSTESEIDQQILDPDQAFSLDLKITAPDLIEAKWIIADGYYLYRDNFDFKITPEDFKIENIQITHGNVKDDPDFGRVEVLKHQAVAGLILSKEIQKDDNVSLTVRYQGCKEDVLCYPPVTKTIPLFFHPDIKYPNLPSDKVNSQHAGRLSVQDSITQKLVSQGLLINLVTFFIFGLLLAFTPCVFPMIPILSGIIVGQGKSMTSQKALFLSMAYVLAMATTYSLLGVITGLFGLNLQAAFQHPAIILSFSLVFVLLALSMFGLFEIQFPAFIKARITEVSNNQQKGTMQGALAMGALSAIIVGPCVAPPLAGALLYISQTGDAILGGFALFVLGLGMGVPLIIVGTSTGHLLPRAGRWMKSIMRLFGVILLGVAIWFLERIYLGAITLALWSILLIVTSIYMGALERADSGWQRLQRGIALVMLTYGIITIIGVASGGNNILNPLEKITQVSNSTKTHIQFKTIKSVKDLDIELRKAANDNKIVMLDFYADWCITCKEMEHKTFSDLTVQQHISNMVLLQADVTKNDDQDKVLLKRFNLFGPPAILFFDHNGEEMSAYRLIGYVKADRFLLHINNVKAL